MFCGNCGCKVNGDDVFCPSCGSRVNAGAGGRNSGGPMRPVHQNPSSNVNYRPPKKKDDKVLVYCLLGVVAVLLIALIGWGIFYLTSSGKKDTGDAKVAEKEKETETPTPTPSDTPTVAATPIPTAVATPVPTVMATPIPTAVVTQPPVAPAAQTSDFVFPESSSSYLSASQVTSLSLFDMYIARNEIYARHGRMFYNADLQAHFGAMSWYQPLYTPEDFDARQDSIFNDVEKENINLIRSIEEQYGSPYL